MTTVMNTRALRGLQLLNPLVLVRSLWRHRNLITQFTRREIEGRYRGSFLGLIWSLANPLFMLGIYTFVFGIVLKARWPEARTGGLGEFAIIIFAGLTAFSFFSECVSRAPMLVVSVPNYVKKVVFPLEILPVSAMGAAFFHMVISLIVLLSAELLFTGTIPWTIVLLPIVLLPAILISLGLMWFVSSLGVFIRDVSQAIGLVMQAMFFFTPIFYSIEAIPEPVRTVILFNPMAPVVENFRRVLLWGQMPSWPGLVMWVIATGIVMVCGFAWFMQTKKAFADVI
jgi:lipopolysaccharide transport system permease protein